MAKQVETLVKLNLPGGQANPGPPAGPTLGQHGVPIMDFINQFNERTKDKKGDTIPVIITIYKDRSFTFETKLPPVASLIKKKIGLEKGAGETGREQVGKLTDKQVKEIAQEKLPDLNTDDLEAAKRVVKGTAKSMGVEV